MFSRNSCAAFAVLAVAVATGVHALGQAAGSTKNVLHPNDGTGPSFDVATVKPSRSFSGATGFGIAPGRFSVEKATAEELIRFAYNVKTTNGIEAGPKWTGSEDFDIDAKISDTEAEAIQKLQPSQRLEQYRLMVQSLLADRFDLVTSTKTEERPVYALVLARNGSKLVAVDSAKQRTPMLWGGSRGELHASSVSMALFADWISGSAETDGRCVIDRTGLKGSYDFTLKWMKIGSEAGAIAGSGASQSATSTIAIEQGEPSLFTALQEQLGLKLQPAKGPVKVVVIDHIERPSPN